MKAGQLKLSSFLNLFVALGQLLQGTDGQEWYFAEDTTIVTAPTLLGIDRTGTESF